MSEPVAGVVVNYRLSESIGQSPRIDMATAWLMLLAIGSSNFLLLNQRLALQAAEAKNLFGPRDLFFLLFLACSLPILLLRSGKVARHPVHLLVFAVSAYALLLGGMGYASGNSTRDILYELLLCGAWCTAPLSAAVLARTDRCRLIAWFMAYLGIAVAVGVYGEVLFRVGLVTSNYYQHEQLLTQSAFVRATPAGWPLMIIGFSAFLFRMQHGRTTGAYRLALDVLGLLLLSSACLLTQSRTLLLGLIVVLCLSLFTAPRMSKLWTVGGVGVVVIGWLLSGHIGSTVGSESFRVDMAERYMVLYDGTHQDSYLQQEMRPRQVKALFSSMGMWAIAGRPLGEPIWTTNPDMPLTMANSDVSFVELWSRFGVSGLLLLALWGWYPIAWLRGWRPAFPKYGPLALSVPAAAFALWVCSMFANVYGNAYLAPLTAINQGAAFAIFMRAREDQIRHLRVVTACVAAGWFALGSGERKHEPSKETNR